MLTPREMNNTRQELQENYRRLGYQKSLILAQTQMTENELDHVLAMDQADPSLVWELRDYLEDMLLKEGKAIYPFSCLADHSVNCWFPYQTPWRNKKADK
ncbi:hypothetical protein SAMN05216431_12016 [Ligilactobacillus sp. WC1T17]|uniref:DUF2316 family protein n=1 Tax=Ligilactobacillus ruminis TaxID=1623 RepID=A0ABY1AEX3_9LACO|nr:hypothetical protein SAMN05216431_12016 [Ligilactobacillus ruminis]